MADLRPFSDKLANEVIARQVKEIDRLQALLASRSSQDEKIRELEAERDRARESEEQATDCFRESEASLKRMQEALEGMTRAFSPHPREDTEGWREEHEAYEAARAALSADPATSRDGGEPFRFYEASPATGGRLVPVTVEAVLKDSK